MARLWTETANNEEYRGEKYQLQRREIATLTNRRGYRVVWCWEVKSGPAEGIYGGKCATKAEARKWARNAIRTAQEEAR